VLDLAHWGVADPSTLAFLDQPPRPALTQAQLLLRDLGAIDVVGRITDEGRRLRALPLPPRLARMVVDAAAQDAGRLAADIALIATERGLGGDDVDLAHRLAEFRRDRSARAGEARRLAGRWVEAIVAEAAARPHPSRQVGKDGLSPGAALALAYPDRIARNRGDGRFLLASGRGATMDQASPLARERFLAVAEIAGSAGQGRIMLAAPLSLAEIEARFSDRIEARQEVSFEAQSCTLRARSIHALGAITLMEQQLPVPAGDESARTLARGIAQVGLERLPWTKALAQWRDRIGFLRKAEGDEWPDLSFPALAACVDEWLTPACYGKTRLSELSADELSAALMAIVPHNLRRRMDGEAPTHFAAPSGSQIPIDYEAPEGPKLSIRVQELFGLDYHPTIAGGRVPLVVELLSPAHRPVQVTRDLPAFWRGSYAAVRSDLRGRYPRHPWPDDPLSAPATRRAKPRGQ
jgi:ATP-dependent helicase HrpB